LEQLLSDEHRGKVYSEEGREGARFKHKLAQRRGKYLAKTLKAMKRKEGAESVKIGVLE